MEMLKMLQDIFGGEIYNNKCVIYTCPQGTHNARFIDESKNLFRYDTKEDLIDDLNYLGEV